MAGTTRQNTLAVTDPDSPVTVRMDPATTPAWVTAASDQYGWHVVASPPADLTPGDYTFTVQAADEYGFADPAEFVQGQVTIRVANAWLYPGASDGGPGLRYVRAGLVGSDLEVTSDGAVVTFADAAGVRIGYDEGYGFAGGWALGAAVTVETLAGWADPSGYPIWYSVEARLTDAADTATLNLANDLFNVAVWAGAGDDDVEASGWVVSLYGGAGADTLSAPVAFDYLLIDGGDGDDTVLAAGGGYAEVRAGAGDDVVHAEGSGSLFVYAGAGDDVVYGGGTSVVYGEDGDDRLYGGAGEDDLWGGAGDDELYGGDGWDRLFGEAGADLVWGGGGMDFLFAEGADVFGDYDPNEDVLFM